MPTQTKTVPVAGLPEAEVEAIRQTLVSKREQLVHLYRQDVQSGQESSDDSADDFVDRANNSYNRELMFSLSDAERQLLIQIDEAVGRLDGSAFGSCTNCSQAIGLPRLRAIPWARYCIDCQEAEEMGMLGR